MTFALGLYRLGTTLAEPFAPLALRRRLKSGKEREDRIAERLGRSAAQRPDGPLLWMHGASVGESQVLLSLLKEAWEGGLRASAVITTQTLTSADLVARSAGERLVHQMAPIDAPGSVRRFLDHWRPDGVVFAEGEIWPNMLRAVARRRLPAALVNARMTDSSLKGWLQRRATARKLFGVFGFVGAADPKTAGGLDAILGRRPDIIGNLKRAMRVKPAEPNLVSAWRGNIGRRQMLLAASTHEGEDELVLDAFDQVRRGGVGRPLLVVAPRHPERGRPIADLCRSRGLNVQLRSQDASPPDDTVDVLVADTLGEMMFWFEVADGVFLGGASVDAVGGHNPMEPAQVHRRVFCGPYGFNFSDTFDALERCGAVVIGNSADDLAIFWGSCLREGPETGADWAAVTSYLAESRAAMTASVAALRGLLRADAA